MTRIEEVRDSDGNLIVRERRSGGGYLVWLALILITAIAIAWLVGLIGFTPAGEAETPHVARHAAGQPDRQADTQIRTQSVLD